MIFRHCCRFSVFLIKNTMDTISRRDGLRKNLFSSYPFGGPDRLPIPSHLVGWDVEWNDYQPPVSYRLNDKCDYQFFLKKKRLFLYRNLLLLEYWKEIRHGQTPKLESSLQNLIN